MFDFTSHSSDSAPPLFALRPLTSLTKTQLVGVSDPSQCIRQDVWYLQLFLWVLYMIMSVLCNKSPAVIHAKLKGHNSAGPGTMCESKDASHVWLASQTEIPQIQSVKCSISLPLVPKLGYFKFGTSKISTQKNWIHLSDLVWGLQSGEMFRIQMDFSQTSCEEVRLSNFCGSAVWKRRSGLTSSYTTSQVQFKYSYYWRSSTREYTSALV